MAKNEQSTESAVREIRRRTRRKFSPKEKIRIVLEGLRGEQSISELCRREGIAANPLSVLKTHPQPWQMPKCGGWRTAHWADRQT
jgi:hypothetical protein